MRPGKATLKYVVVEMEKDVNGQTTLEVVPEVWRDKEGQKCFLYPSHYNSSRVVAAAKKGEPPTDAWKSYPVKKEWLTTGMWYVHLLVSRAKSIHIE